MSEQLLQEILGEIKNINQRVGSIEEGQTRMESGINNLEQRVGNMEEGQAKMETAINNLEQRVGNVEEGLSKLDNKTDRIDLTLLKLEAIVENEVLYKIGALFDGFTLRGDQIENTRKHFDERLDSIEIDTGYLVSKVARLEKVAK